MSKYNKNMDLILLPCPFCGGEAFKDSCDAPGYHSVTIACKECGARVRPRTGLHNAEHVATAWNCRIKPRQEQMEL